MTLQEIQYKAQGIIHKWRDDDSAPYIEFVEELAHMTVPEPSEDLVEAAEEYAYKGIPDELKQHVKPIADEIIKNFIVGAKWDREQMMKGAVEGQIYGSDGSHWVESGIEENLTGKEGDAVKLIIVKMEKYD